MKKKILFVMIFIVFVVLLWLLWSLVFNYRENERMFFPDLVSKLEKTESIKIKSMGSDVNNKVINNDEEIREIISIISNSTNEGYTKLSDMDLNYYITFYDSSNEEIASIGYDPRLQIYYNEKIMYLYNYDNERLSELIK